MRLDREEKNVLTATINDTVKTGFSIARVVTTEYTSNNYWKSKSKTRCDVYTLFHVPEYIVSRAVRYATLTAGSWPTKNFKSRR